MAKATVVLKRTLSTSASIGNITAPASAMRRFEMAWFQLGSEDTPGDNAIDLLIQRCTTAGTRTSVTPLPTNPADAALVTTAGQNHTVEPTYGGGSLWDDAQNQRASVQWYALPGYEIVCPATASNGIGFTTPTAPALKGTLTVGINEY